MHILTKNDFCNLIISYNRIECNIIIDEINYN